MDEIRSEADIRVLVYRRHTRYRIDLAVMTVGELVESTSWNLIAIDPDDEWLITYWRDVKGL